MYTFSKQPAAAACCAEECVYNLLDCREANPTPPPMYHSRYSCFVRQEAACSKIGCYKTMGLPCHYLYPPKDFLKKHSLAPMSTKPVPVATVELHDMPSQTGCNNNGSGDGQPGAAPAAAADNGPTQSDTCTSGSGGPAKKCRIPRICCNSEKPPVPSPCSGFGIIPSGCKDFIRDNIAKSCRKPAAIPAARFVDHAKGTAHDWCTSGYPRKFVCREDFGMIPGYLVARNKELIEKEKQLKCEMEAKEREAHQSCRHLSEEERANMICGLKDNWAQVFHEFQSLPLMIDTQGKVKRKAELEAELKSLEKDIQLLERHNHLFLAQSDKSFYLA